VQFWQVTAYNKTKLKEDDVYVHAGHGHHRLLEILSEVHPEWENIRAEKIKKPACIKDPWT